VTTITQTMPPTAPTDGAAASPNRTRADIQGLRALAVTAVILGHVLGWPSGGFVGVDVFFVISGFLITGLLLRDAETHGSVSLRRFYGRRMRRIAPAAVTVLVATVVGAYFLFNQPRFWSTVGDAVYSFFFVVNWHFAAQGTDYFHAADAVSPLQHFWSLSVEEQFYLVWPWIVVIVVALVLRGTRAGAAGTDAAAADAEAARARRIRLRVLVGVLLGAISLASFAFAVAQTESTPTVAYFSTLTRVWELGVGGLIAVGAPLFARLPLALRVLGGWAGLVGVVASFFLIDDAMPFPGPWAALPVLATAVVILVGVGGAQRHLFPIVNPVTSYIGGLSYSLYLWHFPVLVFVLMLLPAGLEVNLVILGLAFAIALVTYYLIEQPLHRSPWLEPRGRGPADAHGSADPADPSAAAQVREARREQRREEWQDWRDRFGAQFILSSIGAIVIVVVVAVTVQLSVRGSGPFDLALPSGPAAGDILGGGGSPDGTAVDPSATNPEDQLQADLWAAAGATEWPSDLSPSMDTAIAQNSSRNPANACFEVGSTPDEGSCTWGSGDAPNHLYLVGDSTALAYAPAFKWLAENSGGAWKVTAIGLYGCRFTDVLVQNGGAGVMDSCPQRKNDVAAMIAADAPQLVVVSNAFALGQTDTGRPLSATDLVASTVAETAKYGVPGRIVYLAPPPLGADLGRCYSPVTSPQDCNTGVDQAWTDFEAATTAALAASGTGDHYISSLPFSCAQGYCPAFAGTRPTKYDTVHMTPEYSEHIAPALRWELAAQGLM